MIRQTRFYLSLLIAGAAYWEVKTFYKSSGTSFAGKMVLKFYPEFLSHCRKYIKNNVVTVSGTNGKTTTSGIISHIFETSGSRVIHNVKGLIC